MTEAEARELTAEIDPHEDCVEFGNPRRACDGEMIHYRSTLGTPMVRCAVHYEEHMETQDRINRDYPDSPMAPSWFDPADAGERWDDDY